MIRLQAFTVLITALGLFAFTMACTRQAVKDEVEADLVEI
jgi:hypothetical protein